MLGSATRKGNSHVRVRTADDGVVRTRLVAVLDEVDKGFADNKNHG